MAGPDSGRSPAGPVAGWLVGPVLFPRGQRIGKPPESTVTGRESFNQSVQVGRCQRVMRVRYHLHDMGVHIGDLTMCPPKVLFLVHIVPLWLIRAAPLPTVDASYAGRGAESTRPACYIRPD